MTNTNVEHAKRIIAERDLYQRQIDATDKEIDALVYQLYGLTEGQNQDR